jgi:hypothetical protein
VGNWLAEGATMWEVRSPKQFHFSWPYRCILYCSNHHNVMVWTCWTDLFDIEKYHTSLKNLITVDAEPGQTTHWLPICMHTVQLPRAASFSSSHKLRASVPHRHIIESENPPKPIPCNFKWYNLLCRWVRKGIIEYPRPQEHSHSSQLTSIDL